MRLDRTFYLGGKKKKKIMLLFPQTSSESRLDHKTSD